MRILKEFDVDVGGCGCGWCCKIGASHSLMGILMLAFWVLQMMMNYVEKNNVRIPRKGILIIFHFLMRTTMTLKEGLLAAHFEVLFSIR